jgi:hypothetical protein
MNEVTYQEALKRANQSRRAKGRIDVWDLSIALAIIFEKTKEETLTDLHADWAAHYAQETAHKVQTAHEEAGRSKLHFGGKEED